MSHELLNQTLRLGYDHLLRHVGPPQEVKAVIKAIFRRCYGSEFISRDLDLWAYANDVILEVSRPGKPTDNAYIESFNGSFRSEGLNAHWFMSLDDAREELEAWRRDYNTVRPHSAIGNKPPISLINCYGVAPTA